MAASDFKGSASCCRSRARQRRLPAPLFLTGQRLPVNRSDTSSPLVWKALSTRVDAEPGASSLPMRMRMNPSLFRAACDQVTQSARPAPHC
jgi:hypothetical protein